MQSQNGQARKPAGVARWLLVAAIAPALIASAIAQTAPAQNAVPAAQPAAPRNADIPGFWDPQRRPERPDLSRITTIRFMTETDFPPFNYAGSDGNPVGFNVDLARLLCEEIKASCTVQMRRFETLLDSLTANRGDAVIASIAATPLTRARADFTDPYYRTPARFAARRDRATAVLRPEALEGKTVAVVSGTSHEAYLRAQFTEPVLKTFPAEDAARQALRRGEVDYLFGDAVALAYWLNGADSGNCCGFAGGPFLEGRYFGEGIGIAIRKDNEPLRRALNWALFRVWESGRFTDLWLRYFPVNPF